MSSALRFHILVPVTDVQKSGVANFYNYLDSRIMRLTMLEIGKIANLRHNHTCIQIVLEPK